MKKLTANLYQSKTKFLLNALGLGLIGVCFLVFAPRAHAFVTNTINPDDILNDKPDVFLGSDGFARSIYHDNAQELVYVKCLSEICTTSTRTLLNIGSGVINNGNVAAYKKSTGDIRIYFIATDAGVNTIRRIDCDTSDTCTAASIIFTFGNSTFGSLALTVARDSADQARFAVNFLDQVGLATQRLRFFSCTGECTSGTISFRNLFGFPIPTATLFAPSIVLTSSDMPLITFNQQLTATSGVLRYVHCTTSTCTALVNTNIEAYAPTTSLAVGTTDLVIKNDTFPFFVYSRSLDGVLTGKMVSCTDIDCVGRTSIDITNGNQIRALKTPGGTLRVLYQLNPSPTSFRYKTCGAVDCAGATDIQIEANNSTWITPFLNAGNNPQAVYNADPSGGLDLRMACGIEGPVCPSPNLVIRNASGGAAPPITYSGAVVGTPVSFTFVTSNIGLGTSAQTVTNVTTTSSTNDNSNITVSSIAPSSTSSVLTYTTQWNSAGTYNVTFTADSQNDDTESNESDNAVTISVNVAPPGPVSYTLSVAPASQAVKQGGNFDYTVTVNVVSGAPAQVNLTTNDLTADGITQTLTPASLSFLANGSLTSTLHVVVSSTSSPDPPKNPYTLTVTGNVSGLPGSTQIASSKLGVIAAGTAPWLQTTKGNIGSKGPIALFGPSTKVFPTSLAADDNIGLDGLDGTCAKGQGTPWLGGNNVVVGTSGLRSSTYGYVGFNTIGITGKIVLSAKLTLTVKAKVNPGSGLPITLRENNWPATLDCVPDYTIFTNPAAPSFDISTVPAVGQKQVFNLTNTSWIANSANGNSTGFSLTNPWSASNLNPLTYVAYYETEDGSPNAPVLEVTVANLYTHTDYLGISNSTINAEFTSAKNWVVPSYSGGINSIVPTGQDVYSYLYNKFEGAKATVLNPAIICTPPGTFGFGSYGFKNDTIAPNIGNAGNCVVTDLNTTSPPPIGSTHLNLFNNGGYIDNGVFVFKGDGTHTGDLTWNVSDTSGGYYTIPSGNPTIIFITGNLYINKAIWTSNGKKFIFIVKNDSNGDGAVDTDDAIQVDPMLNFGGRQMDGFFLTSGKFNSFSWLNTRNQIRYNNALAIDQKVKEYRAFTGNYPLGVSTYDTSDGCSWNTGTAGYWFEPTPTGLGPVGNTNWDGKTAGVNNLASPCSTTQGLRYELNRSTIPGYTPIDLNAAGLKDPTNGAAVPGKPSVLRPKRFALRYGGLPVSGSATANTYDIFFSAEDDGGFDKNSTIADPEFHICGGNYNDPDPNNQFNSSGWIGGIWPRVPATGDFCYVQKLIINGGLYADGGFSFGRDLRDDNNSPFDAAGNPHPVRPAEQVNLDPSFYYLFAKNSLIGSQSTILKELAP